MRNFLNNSMVWLSGALLAAMLMLLSAASAAATRMDFDHMATGFPLTGAHVRVECESCHNRGLFKGTPMQCSGCHTPSGVVRASTKSLRHINSTNACGDCHSANSWTAVTKMDHGAALGSC